jgi:hypothetical protein
MGKLRLVQALQFMSRHVPPQNWSLLYSNVDNLIIVLEDSHSLDEAVFLANVCKGYAKYLEEKHLFVAASDNSKGQQQVNSGQLKLERICQSSLWKFITGGVQHYVLREEDDDNGEEKEAVAGSHQPMLWRQKRAGLNNISNDRAFEYTYSLMFGSKIQIAIPQDRRICKLGSMATQHQYIIVCRRLVVPLPRSPPQMPPLPPSPFSNDDASKTLCTSIMNVFFKFAMCLFKILVH